MWWSIQLRYFNLQWFNACFSPFSTTKKNNVGETIKISYKVHFIVKLRGWSRNVDLYNIQCQSIKNSGTWQLSWKHNLLPFSKEGIFYFNTGTVTSFKICFFFSNIPAKWKIWISKKRARHHKRDDKSLQRTYLK